ncbi:MAG TPA: BamA/TamA family outer membrane protein [Ignavibacteriaceae bacterium]|nr:BamA/TamA family outer membrane protein [Ignavibacteriaceae bacterium]
MKYKLLIILFFVVSFCTTEAQIYFFGRNKVQWDKFNWKVIETEHFNIYYYDEMQVVASIGAAYAEEVYEELKIKLNHVVTYKIPLIFYNTSLHFQQTNTTPGFIPDGVGGFFEFLKGRVVIPNTGSLSDFKHVIRHELVHVFVTTKILRIQKDHKKNVSSFPPLWFTEGVAEFLSTKVDAQAEMVMRDAVINNNFFSLDQMNQIYGTFLMYKEGQNFLEYIKDQYGEEKVIQFIDNFWMYSDFEDVIAYTIGEPIEEIDKGWLMYLKKKYFPLLQSNSPVELDAKKLTDWGFNFTPKQCSIDSIDYVYFVANRDGYSSIYRFTFGEEGEALSPELVLRGEKTDEFEAFHPFYSSIDISNNKLLAFVSKSGATDAIYLYDIVEDEINKKIQFDFLVSLSSPKFSDDSNQLIFQAVDRKGFSDIFSYNLLTSELLRLTNDYYDDREPVFASTNQIIFSSDRTNGEFAGKYNLFSYDFSTKKISPITYFNSNSTSPIISADKKLLYFTSDIDGVKNIWKMDLSDKLLTDKIFKVTSFLSSSFYPSLVDSTKILFGGFENFSFNIYSLDLTNLDTDSIGINVSSENISQIKWIPNQIITPPSQQELKYEKEYTLDYAQSQIVTDPIYGTRGGAILTLSDLLGDDRYDFLIFNSAQAQSEFLKSFNIVMQKINLSGRTNYGYGIFHFSGRRYDVRDADLFYFERSFGGYFGMNYPLSKFQRIEATLTVANSDKEVIEGVIERKALLVSNSLSYVIDNSLWGPSGPVDGIRAKILLGYTGDVKFSNVNYFSVIADYRHYFRLGFLSTIALRTSLYYNQGKEARRYLIGGSWDLRGYPLWSIRGEKAWVSSAEVRFPLIDEINLKLPFVNIGFGGIRGALFFDAGGAWDNKYIETLGSVGFGFRINLFGLLVLRYDIGKRIEQNFTKFQPRLFYQFFFGWDF